MASFYAKHGKLWLSYYDKGKRICQPIINPSTGATLIDNRQNRRYAQDVVLNKAIELKSVHIQVVTLEYAINSFINQLAINKSTLGDMKNRLNLFASLAGGKRKLSSINEKDITAFDKNIKAKRIIKIKNKERLSVPLSETTISNYYRHVYSFFKYCQKKEWIKEIPFERKKKVKKIKTVKRVIPNPLMLKLFQEIKSNEKHYRVFKLLALTGFRPIEAAALRWEDIDFHTNRIIFKNTKVGREDIFPLSGNEYSNAVREFLWSFKQSSGKVLGFKNVYGFRFLNVKLKKIIGEQYTIYDIRTTFCTNLLLQGADIYSVQKLMRHKDLQTTLEHYTYIEMIKVGANHSKIHDIYKQF